MNGPFQQLELRRLGFESQPSGDLEVLRAIYRAWWANVPFDSVRKTIALRTTPDLPLPGGHAIPFFESWLSGGTCRPTSNALFELLRSLGFAARRITGCVRDLGIVNHASLTVAPGGHDFPVDSALLSNVPLPLNQGGVHPPRSGLRGRAARPRTRPGCPAG
jgi:arylamine N-acetyltransferase